MTAADQPQAMPIATSAVSTRRVERGDNPQILIEADATDPSAASGAVSTLSKVASQALLRAQGMQATAAESARGQLQVVVHQRYNPEGVSQYNIVPGLLGVILQMTMVMMTAMALTRETERGTMENLLAMPASPLEIMLGKVLPYACVGAVQVVWIAWGFLPEQARPWTFIVAAALELLVPIWAERPGMTSWHPHHIAERYGLFTIILLGESVSASAIGVQSGLEAHGVSPALVVIAAAGLVLLFALWWLYFLEPAGEGLESRRNRSFYWGYGHYFVFASLAAIGAGLEVAVQRGAAHADASDAAVEYAIAIPVAVFLLMLYILHAPLVPEVVIRPLKTGIAILLVLLAPLASPLIGLVGVTIVIALVASGLVAATLIDRAVAARRATSDD